jgi:hypothetical protein
MGLEDVVARFFPNSSDPGYTSEEIADGARRLDLRLPTKLTRFYQDAPVRGPLGTVQEQVLGPHELRVASGTLLFCVENQGVCLWGIPLDRINEDDPPVVRAANEAVLAWEPDHDRLSDFLVTLVYWQCVNGALGNTGIADAPEGVVQKVPALWPEIALGPNTWGIRFFGKAGQLVCLAGEDQVSAAGVSESDLREISASLGIDWDFLEYGFEEDYS